MEISSKIRPVDAYSTKTISATVVSRPLGKSSPSGNPDKHEIERLRLTIADTAQKVADDIKKFLNSKDDGLVKSPKRAILSISLLIISVCYKTDF